jgi:hypothetical protein
MQTLGQRSYLRFAVPRCHPVGKIRTASGGNLGRGNLEKTQVLDQPRAAVATGRVEPRMGWANLGAFAVAA